MDHVIISILNQWSILKQWSILNRFFFFYSARVALHNSQLRLIIIYFVLGLGGAP